MALSLEQKTTQKLSPVTIQLASMIQMTNTELESFINELVQNNPVFEMENLRVHDFDYRAPKRDSLKNADDNESADYTPQESVQERSLYEDVCAQLEGIQLQKPQIKNAKIMARFLDERGYIQVEDFDYISESLGQREAAEALAIIQSLSPTGIGARDLTECLCLQLREMPNDTRLAEKIVQEHLDLLSKGHYLKISRLTEASPEHVLRACAQIRTLTPKPCMGYDYRKHVEYIIPDFILDKSGVLSLNSKFVPSLTISAYYKNLLTTSSDLEVVDYLNMKFQQAQQIISNLNRRNITILKCAEAIIQQQSLFFSSGGKAKISSLTQAQLAEQTGLSESTVSRAIRGKYIQCPFGMYSLESFFHRSLDAEKSEISTASVKSMIKAIIDLEDKNAPFSDQNIVDILQEKGIDISRRTVAKYRQQLGIQGTFARKEHSLK